MYEKHFRLRERPFALSPDPDYLYPSRVHREALGYLRYGIEGHAGFVVITGEIGSGKTTMLQALLGRLDRSTAVSRIVNTMLDPRELLDAIVLDFGMDPTGLSKPVLLHRLAGFLVQQRQAGRLTLLVVDEAQNLSLPALEEIRMLSNLETEKSKLIQIVMTGQPELRDTLQLPQLEQLRQRITVSYHLQPLDVEETASYITHRLARAAIGAPMEFPRDVAQVIHRRSRGVPRLINVIADATLLFAYGLDRRDVDVGVVQEALAELDATGVLQSYEHDGAAAAAQTPAPVAETGEAARMVDEVRRRERQLAERERQLAQREQAIAAQQRVVEEEARLLSAARAAASGRSPESTAPVPGPRPAEPSTGAAARPPEPPTRAVTGTPPRTTGPANATAPPRGAGDAVHRTPPPPARTDSSSRVGAQTARGAPPPPRAAAQADPDAVPAAYVSIPSQGRNVRVAVQACHAPVVHSGGFWRRLRHVLFGPSSRTAAPDNPPRFEERTT